MTGITWVEQWAGIGLFFVVCLFWGSQDKEVGAIAAVGFAAFLTYDMGWIQVPTANAAAFGIALSCLGALAVLAYMRKREDVIT